MGDRALSSPVAVLSGGGTGGHLYPALALADALAAVRPDLRVFFVGAAQGVEARIVPERGLDHLLLPVRGFRRGRVLENLSVAWALLRSVILTGQLFSRLRPGVVVATGGYACGPAGLTAAVMGIPLAVQEQNARPGFTTRILSRWSRQVHLAFPEARQALPPKVRSRAVISGNPIREVIREDPRAARAGFGLELSARVLLVVGGSQGARALNEATLGMVEAVVEGGLDWPRDVALLWATGPANLDEVHDRLQSLGRPPWVQALGYIEDMPKALCVAELAVSRAGAMTTAELLAWGVPAVLVPLPTAAADHQTRNAESLAAVGAAVHIPESGLTGQRLGEVVTSLFSDPGARERMKTAARTAGRPGAALEIARALASLLPPPPASRDRGEVPVQGPVRGRARKRAEVREQGLGGNHS